MTNLSLNTKTKFNDEQIKMNHDRKTESFLICISTC